MVITLTVFKNFQNFNVKVNMRFKDQTIEKKMISENKFIFKTSVVFTIFSVVAYFAATVPIFGDEHTFMPLELVIHEYAKPFSLPLHILMSTSFFTFSLLLIYPSLLAFYIYILAKNQIYIIVDELLRISEGFCHLEPEKLVDNEEYQDIIYQRLTSCIKKHIRFVK